MLKCKLQLCLQLLLLFRLRLITHCLLRRIVNTSYGVEICLRHFDVSLLVPVLGNVSVGPNDKLLTELMLANTNGYGHVLFQRHETASLIGKIFFDALGR